MLELRAGMILVELPPSIWNHVQIVLFVATGAKQPHELPLLLQSLHCDAARDELADSLAFRIHRSSVVMAMPPCEGMGAQLLRIGR